MIIKGNTLYLYLADLHLRQPDIVCFTESNLKSTTPDRLLTIQDYRLFRRDRVTGRKKSGGGVIVYVRDEIHAETVKLAQVYDFDSIAETLWLKVKIDKKKAALLCCLYRPPSTNHNQIHADFNDIEDQIQSVITMYPSHRIILAGDLNADSKTNPLAHSRSPSWTREAVTELCSNWANIFPWRYSVCNRCSFIVGYYVYREHLNPMSGWT